MKSVAQKETTEATAFASAEQIALVVLNIYSSSSKHLYSHLSEGARISTPDPAYEMALELFENTRLKGSIIWINAEGVTLDELAQLEKQWLPIAGKAIMLMGSNDAPVINRSLQGLMSARRDNAAFEAVVLTHKDTAAATTARLIASQSAGWLRHEVKDSQNPQGNLASIMRLLDLTEQPIAPTRAVQPASAKIIELPLTDKMPAPQTNDYSSLEVADADIKAAITPQIPSPSPSPSPLESNSTMATLTDSMNACMQIDGAMAAALIDYGSGMALAKIGGGVNLDVAAAGNTEVIKAKMKTMASLGIKDTIEDILITLGTQYHLIRPVPHKQGLFLYLVLDKTKGNLAMARFKLMEIEKGITV
jgi:hypothetical protein